MNIFLAKKEKKQLEGKKMTEIILELCSVT
jgi:hypothetical protein